MGVKNFGKNNNTAATNYSVRTLPDGKRSFMTECSADTQGAIALVRSKDGKNHKAGDEFFCRGGNAIGGVVNGFWLRDGYQSTVAKELNIGFSSIGDDGKPVREFLQLSLMDDKGRIDSNTARALIALNKAELGEEVTLAIHTFLHKAGDTVREGEDAVWSKDGYITVLSAYQDHLATDENPNGRIGIEENERYNQPRYYVKGKDVIELGVGEKAPAGATEQFDADNAMEFLNGVIASLGSKVVKTENLAPSHTDTDDDHQFGGDPDQDEAARNRMRPS